jgi:hypothetical protein
MAGPAAAWPIVPVTEKLPAALVPPPPAITDEVIGPIDPPCRSIRTNRPFGALDSTAVTGVVAGLEAMAALFF